MTHDPLCPIQPPVVGSGSTDPAIRTMPESAGVPCQCDLIAKVRADERKQAGARVANLTSWEDGWPENVVVSRMSAIYAAEGEENE